MYFAGVFVRSPLIGSLFTVVLILEGGWIDARDAD